MASKALSNPLFQYVAKRGYAGALALPAATEAKIQSCVTATNTLVASLENGSPVTRITVAFKAGSRYEPPTETGIAHLLRSAAGLTTGNASSFIIARKLAQAGASVTASGDREFLYYTLETTQANLNGAIECLHNLVSCQEFRPWEISDITPRLKYDIVSLSPQIRAIDLLHKAAYRTGLGNSLFMSPRRIGSFSSESLQHFAQTTVIPSRCAVVVVGDSQEKGLLIAQALQLPCANTEAYCKPTKYFGGEMRKEMGGDLAHVALALPGLEANNPGALALAVAAKALGSGPSTKWGADHSLLSQAIGNIGPFAAAGFNVSYSDGGLFGVVLSAPKDEVCNAVKAVAKLLKNCPLDSNSIAAGKNQLKLQVLTEAENGTALAESLAAQGLYTGSVKSPTALAHAISSISDSDVVGALQKISACKLSMGSVGNLAFVPWVDEL
ncbi:cytochrome b-c1 complex subunit 2, mitochondrial [Pectinophora gossypiella]|uniref:cytochrome b-c1 complex subunit 2, mitochondrial n=1 Tax=Pectinophora gossypiella TaxID=13191 RepID=UPI00214EE20B|nr:cytochrome b-c1 complex subunit 2, mitochondrial [Pectinophora gossypiella]